MELIFCSAFLFALCLYFLIVLARILRLCILVLIRCVLCEGL